MLSATERSIVERERDVPGLGTLLDPDLFLEALRARVDRLELLSARRTYIRYKPGANCIAAYTIETESGPLELYGKAHGRDASTKFAKASARQQVASVLGPGRLLFDEDAIAVSIFPNDSKLSALPDLAEVATRLALLESIMPGDPRLAMSEYRRIAYKPERRYVAGLEIEGEPWGVLKLYTRDGYRSARRRALAFQPGELLRVPQLLGKWSHPGAVITAWLQGRRLSDALADGDLDLESVARVGAALAELHGQEPPVRLPLQRPNVEIDTLFSLVETVGHLLPGLASRAWALARRLSSLLEERHFAPVSVHGDFYAKQVLVDAGHIAFLDLDGAARAAPEFDLGVFIAHLERDALRGNLARSRVEPMARAFLKGYAGGRSLPVELYVAAGLFRLLHDPFRHCEPDWEQRIEALLARAERILPEAGARPGAEDETTTAASGDRMLQVPIADRFGVTEDPAMPFLCDALDPEAIESQLSRYVLGNTRFALRAVRVARHKAGRRCLIEYELELDDAPVTLLGKVRAKGLDSVAYQVTASLRRAGLGPESENGISVPEALGSIPVWNMWLQRKVSGVTATELLVQPGGVELARRIAAAIHELHQVSVPVSRRHTMQDELRILHERLPRVAQENPAWSKRLERVLDACDRLGAATRVTGSCGIHRDFYPDHVIVDGDRLYIIDLDLYCEGDPALDIGNFSAHLIEQGLRASGDPDALAAVRTALEEAFYELAGQGSREAVAAYTALTLVRHIHISTLLPKRRRLSERLLELSEQSLGVEH